MRECASVGPAPKHLCGARFLALALAAARPASAAELYGLVVGVDDYVGEANDLDGAVNDAAGRGAGIATSRGASEVIRLVNADATKDRIARGLGGVAR